MVEPENSAFLSYRARLNEALQQVREAIEAAARRSGRDPSRIQLVAVTKGHDLSAVEAAVDAGLDDLGENRIEEIERKSDLLIGRLPRWHLIGHLQGRKAGRAWGRIQLLHSLDSLRLAERIGGGGPVGVDPLPVLLQVNISGEESKGGFEPSEVSASLPTLLSLPFLRVVGLMTMAPFTEDEEVIRRTFRGLRELQEKLKESFPAYEGIELSMGMSNDFELAVEEGSTILRLGTVLFGERPA
jgi:pyridoxal phosphate enzyme (YggS family)